MQTPAPRVIPSRHANLKRSSTSASLAGAVLALAGTVVGSKQESVEDDFSMQAHDYTVVIFTSNRTLGIELDRDRPHALR